MADAGDPIQLLYADWIANLGYHKLLFSVPGASCGNTAHIGASRSCPVGMGTRALAARYDMVRLDNGTHNNRYAVDPGADGNATFRSIYLGDCVLLASSISFYAQWQMAGCRSNDRFERGLLVAISGHARCQVLKPRGLFTISNSRFP